MSHLCVNIPVDFYINFSMFSNLINFQEATLLVIVADGVVVVGVVEIIVAALPKFNIEMLDFFVQLHEIQK